MTAQARALFYVGGGSDGAPIDHILQINGLQTQRVDRDGAVDFAAADVAVISVGGDGVEVARASELVSELARRNIATLLVGMPDEVALAAGPLVERVPATASDDAVAARISTFARYAPLVKRLDRELYHLQRLGKRLNHHFADIDQEMRLAGRLQRDFLPRQMPGMPGLTFEAIYRPASWVSGDIYDVFRIDEHRVGIFIADAVGHGLAAGLLTMFLRQALVSKRIDGARYDIVPPSEAISQLHHSLLRQSLPHCWFVTASYLIVDTQAMTLTHARGGHPYPIHIAAGGVPRELQVSGPLLGLADIEDSFEQQTIPLSRGDKLVIYSDGVENEFIATRDSGAATPTFTPQFASWCTGGAHELAISICEHLDGKEGSINPDDDVTIVIMEVQ